MNPLRRRNRSAGVLCAFAALAALGCGDDGPPLVEGVIDRETFIDTYVELRANAVEAPESILPDDERERILAQHGVDAGSMLAFVEAYGRYIDYMNEVWSEVQRRFEALTPTEPTGAGAD